MTATVACASLVNRAAAAGRFRVMNAATAEFCNDHEARSKAPRMSKRVGLLDGIGARLWREESTPKHDVAIPWEACSWC